MKKSIKLLSIILISLFMINVNAKEVQIYFYSEGGKSDSKDFKVIDDYVTYKDGTNHATYKDTDTIKVINSIKGNKFKLKKNGTYQVFGKEWYTTNYNNNKYYYLDETKSYKVSDLIAKLGLTSDSYPVISFFANWEGDYSIDPTSPIEEKPKAKSISLSTSKKTIADNEKTRIEAKFNPSNAKTEIITWTSSNKKIATVNTVGTVSGVSKGTVTITAKTKSGLKATIKIKITESKAHVVYFRYKENGGKLTKPHKEEFSSKNGDIYRKGKINIHKITYGQTLSSSGLADYNNTNFINIKREGYTAKKGAEWNTKADGTGKSYSQTKKYKASDFCNASKKDCTVTLYVNWEKEKDINFLTQSSVNIYKGRYYNLNNFVKGGVGSVSWSSENGKIATVNKEGVVHALADGSVNIVAKTKNGTDKIKVQIKTQTNSKNYNLTNCTKMDVKTTGTPVKLEDCIPDVDLRNPANGTRHQIQGIAISDQYVYYSSPMNGAWLTEAGGTINNTDDATTRKITTIYIVRVPRKSTTMEYMQIEYAGHGQGLDTSIKTADGKEMLYLNLASKFNDATSLLNGRVVRGTMYRGVGITTFTGSTNKANLRHPGKVVSITKSENKLVLKTSSDFKKNGSFNATSYNNYLKSAVRNDNYRVNPETSVDEVNKRVAVRSGHKVLIYNEAEFRNGKGTPIYSFTIDNSGTQGDDIYGNYFYTIGGMTDVTIKKYDIRTGTKVAETYLDFTEFLKDNGYVSVEPEGISFNKGVLYAGLVTRPCAQYEGGSCSNKISYNSIVKVSGI